MADTAIKIQQLYIALFGRPTDAVNLKARSAAVDSGAMSLAALSMELANDVVNIQRPAPDSAAETITRIEQLYENLFGRAPDMSGLVFWSQLFFKHATGAQATGLLLPSLIAGAQGSDLDVLNAKTSAAMALSAALDTRDEIAAYASPKAQEIAGAYLDKVLGAASLAAATTPFALKQVTDGIVSGMYVAPETLAEEQLQRLYVTYFGRPADPNGLAFWMGALDGNPDSPMLDKIAGMFAQSAEYLGRISNLSPEHLVSAAYNEMFNRDPEAAGLMFWANAIRSGAVSSGEAIAAIADGAQGHDLFVIGARTQVASAITAAIDTPAEILFYASHIGALNVKQHLMKVVDTASLQTALDPAGIDAVLAGWFPGTVPLEPADLAGFDSNVALVGTPPDAWIV